MRVEVYAAAALLVVAAGVGTTVYLTSGKEDRFADCRTGAVAGGDIGGPFTLVSETGATVTDADVITKPTLMYFGYTFCPDVCPLDTVRNADAAAILADRGYDVLPVFVSVDPKRDTPQVMDDFTANIDERTLGLTGSPEQIAKVAGEYKVFYKAHDDEDPDYYLVDHSTFTYLMLPEIGFVDFFRRDETAEQMADRVACMLDAA
jgi:protein SCO1/2